MPLRARHQLRSKVQCSTVYDLSKEPSRCLVIRQYTTVWLRLSGLGTEFSKQIKRSMEHYDIQDRKLLYCIELSAVWYRPRTAWQNKVYCTLDGIEPKHLSVGLGKVQ